MDVLHALPDFSKYSTITVALILIMSAVVSPVAEEAGFRGYFQVALQSRFRGWRDLDCGSSDRSRAWTYTGLLMDYDALLLSRRYHAGDDSIPHEIHPPGPRGSQLRFAEVFRRCVAGGSPPTDKFGGGTDTWFWIHSAQAVVFAAIAVMAFIKLARLAELPTAIAA